MILSSQCGHGVPHATDESSEPLRWRLGHGMAALEQCAGAWDDLAHGGSLSPTADALWMRCFWRAFGGDDRLLTVHALYAGDTLLAVLPLRPAGRGIRRWTTISNVHTPYCLFAADEGCPECFPAILDHLLDSADVLEFERLPADGVLCRGLADAAHARGLVVVQSEQGGDQVIELLHPWERFCLSVPTRMRREAARKMRQLERLGKVEFEVITREPRLSPTLEACLELETKGWKGASGSPIKCDPRTQRFYTELARSAARAGRFALYLLKLDGCLIAYEYCLRAQHKIDQLKPSFDPRLSSYSPGNVLRYRILQKEVSEGEISSYHLGPPSAWKYHWTKRVDPLVRLQVFGRGLRGRLAFRTGPALRSALKRVRVLRAAVRWARGRRRSS